MRIVTWNCYRGDLQKRAAKLAHLAPDVTILQECGRPKAATNNGVWFGERDIQGIGVVGAAGYAVSPGPVDPAVTHTAFPVEITGGTSFRLLGVWAQARPTYVRAIWTALDAYADWLEGHPCVIAGDFNSHPIWDKRDRAFNHTTLVQRLQAQFGLVSAYHAARGASAEEPTYFWYRKESRPFHLDYCFIPTGWASELRGVSIGGFAEWANESDHRPLVIDLNL